MFFKNKYRISSVRMQSWDYKNTGLYFVTICTKNRIHYFGEIPVETPCMASLQSTEIGKIAYNEWYKTIKLRPDMNIELGEFVVMPNHIHGIIIIGENQYNKSVETPCMASLLQQKSKKPANQFGPQTKNLSSIIRGYKSAVTNYSRKNSIEFNWQPNYYEHIIRSYDDYLKISDYILNNPLKWEYDEFF